MPYFGGQEYSLMQEHKQNLNKNYSNIQILLRKFENLFKIKGRTRIYKCADGETFLLYVPKQWVQYTYLTSLYSLLVRIGQFYDGKTNVLEFVKNFNTFMPDQYLAKTAFEKMQKILELKSFPVQDLSTIQCPHNLGIVGFKF